MELRKAFARNLRLSRASAGYSQEELADLAELDRTYISALERCIYSASLDTIERIAKALRVAPAELLRLPENAKMARRKPRGSHA
jgi:transcriptional regulator with XRE-family HTH domain